MCLAPASDLQRTHHEDSSNTGCVIKHPVQTDARGIASSTNVPDREQKRQYLLTVFVGDMVSLFAGHRLQERDRSSQQEESASSLRLAPGSPGRERFDEIATATNGTDLQAKGTQAGDQAIHSPAHGADGAIPVAL